jgi:hypothetical protein
MVVTQKARTLAADLEWMRGKLIVQVGICFKWMDGNPREVDIVDYH